jgi:exopolyphosphatase / guanosine-5'-triphosphate,3'-diphosphate pyrophosphatase
VLKAGAGRTFYCIGGTWRNLARLHMHATGYPLAVMHHYEMDVEGSAAFLRQVARGEIDKMKGIERVSKNRRALLAYGAAVLQEVIEVAGPSRIVLSALGVREGFLYSLLSPAEQRLDPLISASEELALLRARSVTHAHELVDWTGHSFAVFGIDETEDEARYRQAACLLADIGWRAHPEYRGTQSLNIISHASFIGVDHPGRAFLALANLFRHEGLFDDAVAPEMRALAPQRYLERARIVGGLLRVVYLLSASLPGVIPRLRWEARDDGSIDLVLPRDLEALNGERPAGRLAQLARVTGRTLRLVVGD